MRESAGGERADDGPGRRTGRVARYPRRAVLDGCPHCNGSVLVDEHDLFSLTISLGNTVGDRADVKALLVLPERLLLSDDLEPVIVLGNSP